MTAIGGVWPSGWKDSCVCRRRNLAGPCLVLIGRVRQCHHSPLANTAAALFLYCGLIGNLDNEGAIIDLTRCNIAKVFLARRGTVATTFIADRALIGAIGVDFGIFTVGTIVAIDLDLYLGVATHSFGQTGKVKL